MLLVFSVSGFLLLLSGYFILTVLNYLDKVGYNEREEKENVRTKP
jgi:hypothetical protein